MESNLRNFWVWSRPIIAVPVLALIGASAFLFIDSEGEQFQARNHWERSLQDEILSNKGPDEIFAWQEPDGPQHMFPKPSGFQVVLRIRGNSASISRYLNSDPAREYRREMKLDEIAGFKSFIQKNAIDSLESYDSGCPTRACGEFSSDYVYYHLTKERGNRLTITDLRTDPASQIYLQLVDVFGRLHRLGEYQVRYLLADQIKGLEVLFVGKDKSAKGICKDGLAIRVLVSGKSKDSKPEWRDFSQGILGDNIERQKVCPPIGLANFTTSKLKRSPETASGAEVITQDGKWVVERNSYNRLVRISRRTWHKYVIALPNMSQPEESNAGIHGVFRLPKQDKILIEMQRAFFKTSELRREYRLLDPNDGRSEMVTGDVGPLMLKFWDDHDLPLPLQPTGRPHEYWTKNPITENGYTELNANAYYGLQNVHTEIGQYDVRKFTFKSICKLPFKHDFIDHFWVDEADGKVYLVYQGDLLRFPFNPN